jgi:feruloyl esterase
MASIGKTTAALRRYQRQWQTLTDMPQAFDTRGSSKKSPSVLKEITGFGSNPGNLRMKCHVPKNLAPQPALVVVLHGCSQTAEGYNHGTGWSRLADAHGFVVLFPEQQTANNPKNCFTWFSPEDTRRDSGEALSIRQMVEKTVQTHGVDRGRIYATGLSAGGAMTSVMLATYPDVFAGGAIIAGLPYGAASTVNEAFQSMFQGDNRPADVRGDVVRGASSHRGPWPRVSIWHGTGDTTVVPGNAGESLKQWLNVHGLKSTPDDEQGSGGHSHRQWRGADGNVLVEDHVIAGLGHGTPLDARAGAEIAGPFLLDAGISSTWHIAQFWGLTGSSAATASKYVAPASPTPHAPSRDTEPKTEARGFDVSAVITKSLKSAGLMR